MWERVNFNQVTTNNVKVILSRITSLSRHRIFRDRNCLVTVSSQNCVSALVMKQFHFEIDFNNLNR